MGDTRFVVSVRQELDCVCDAASRKHRVPTEIIDRAARATFEAMTRCPSRSGEAVRLRTRRYFWAVVRREASRTGSRDVSARFVLKAVIDDLTASGRDPRAVWEQIDRDWARVFPLDVLEDYRRQLCA
ncbi:MAG: hypothetical protein U1E26_10105 [Coriobacteriia bacterium]|nr:hypothetical protein [Coriobacteriia bacterium]